jgi:hypothetical protein
MGLAILVMVGIVFGVFVVGAVMLHVLLALLFLPIKIGFGLVKAAGALVVLPVAAVVMTVAAGGLALLAGFGLIVFILHAIF